MFLFWRYEYAGALFQWVFHIAGFDPCNTAPPSPSTPEQFIHLEQSPNLRQNYDCLIAALKATLAYKVHVPAGTLEEYILDRLDGAHKSGT